MSQTKDIKESVLKVDDKKPVQKKAKLCGIIRGCGSITINMQRLNLTVESENLALILKSQKLFMQVYNIDLDIITIKNNLHSEIHKINVRNAKDILLDLHIIGSDNQISYSLENNDFLDTVFLSAFFCGLFLACGSVNVTNGYHLELVFSNEFIASQVQEKLAELQFMPKKVARRSSFVVYLKESEQITDFFAFIGANNVVFQLSDIMLKREVRNLANRQANCITANIDKTVNAVEKQLSAIYTIESIIGLDSLDGKLQEVAKLRIQYPNETLLELSEVLGGKISKSAINHRFRKIVDIAKELGGK